MIDTIRRTSTVGLAVSMAAVATVSTVVSADTITVCLDGTCDFTDPVAAAAVAVDGDVIEIAAGTYLLEAPVGVYGPSIEIRGAVDGKGRPATILDGQGTGSVLGLLLFPQSSVRIENVVITNGYSEYGGGIFLRDGAYVFENCLITDNHADVQGGGMFLNGGANATLIGCEISGNTAAHPTFGTLGVAAAGWVGDGVLTLRSCEVTGNTAAVAGGGFGVAAAAGMILDGSRLCGNEAPTDPQLHVFGMIENLGGCIEDDCDDCTPTIPADLNGNGVVNGADLGFMLAAWGPCAGCPADLNGDGVVNGADLGLLLAAWG